MALPLHVVRDLSVDEINKLGSIRPDENGIDIADYVGLSSVSDQAKKLLIRCPDKRFPEKNYMDKNC